MSYKHHKHHKHHEKDKCRGNTIPLYTTPGAILVLVTVLLLIILEIVGLYNSWKCRKWLFLINILFLIVPIIIFFTIKNKYVDITNIVCHCIGACICFIFILDSSPFNLKCKT